MARDFEDIHDLDDLSDDELRELVRQHLAANNAIDADDIEVRVDDGRVVLEGRVGTDEERRIAEHVVTDILGIESVENEIFVDPVRRAESPEPVDEHIADEERREGLVLGDRPSQQSPEVEETLDDPGDLLYGTTDVRKSIEGANAWIPPESPTPEGPAGPGELGEDH